MRESPRREASPGPEILSDGVSVLASERTDADIQVIVLSRSAGMAEDLRRAQTGSTHRVRFAWLNQPATFLAEARRLVEAEAPFLPTVLIVDHDLDAEVGGIVDFAQRLPRRFGVDLVFANAPDDAATASGLAATGARLFQREAATGRVVEFRRRQRN